MPRNGKLVRTSLVVAAAATVAVVAVATAGTASARSGSASVGGAGSTFVAPLVAKWMAPVKQQLGLQLNYNAIGSGGGVSAITNKQVDFGASDAPLSQFSPTCSTCVQIPWALAATGVIYNLSGLQHLNMTGSVLAQIYMGKITKWNAPAIKKLNQGKALPSTSITVVHRSDSSGTTYNFADYLSHVSHAWKSHVGTGTAVAWPTGEGEKGSSGVAGAVGTTPGAIGYTDVYYAVHNHLGLFRMKNRSGNFVQARAKGIQAAALLDTHPAKDGSLSIVDPPKSTKFRNAYPISTYTYVDVQKSSSNAAKIKKLINWAITKGQSYGAPLVFEPLPKPVVTFDKKQIKKIHS
jgi:phosphate transport system substrate-binding protein